MALPEQRALSFGPEAVDYVRRIDLDADVEVARHAGLGESSCASVRTGCMCRVPELRRLRQRLRPLRSPPSGRRVYFTVVELSLGYMSRVCSLSARALYCV